MPSSQDALLQSVTCSTCTRWRLQLGRTGHTWMWRVVLAEISAFNIHLWHHFKDFRFQKERQNEPQEGKYVVILKTDWRQAWELWWNWLGLKSEQGALLCCLLNSLFGFFTSFLSQKSWTSDFVLLFLLLVIKWFLADKHTPNENTKIIALTKKKVPSRKKISCNTSSGYGIMTPFNSISP